MMILRRPAFLMFVAVAAVVGGCGNEIAAGEATAENAIAAYVTLSADRSAATDLLNDVTMAGPGEPSSPAGFYPGVRAAFVVVEVDQDYGLAIVFQADVTAQDRELVALKTIDAGLGPLTWLGHLDYWPDCQGEDDCYLVGDTPTLP